MASAKTRLPIIENFIKQENSIIVYLFFFIRLNT